MSTVTRLQLKAMMDSWGAFDTSVKLSENALAASKAKKYHSLTQLVHENYFKFDKDVLVHASVVTCLRIA